MSLYIGVDIGAQSIKSCLTDEFGRIFFQSGVPTGPETEQETFLDGIRNLVLDMKSKAEGKVFGIGIGSPGPIDKHNGILISSANLPMLKNVPIVDSLEKEFGIPVRYDNDANCAALGEYWFGVGKNSPNLVVLTLGTGLGGGWILDGKLFDGYNGNSMEVGHTTVEPGGALCGCGHRGCIEAYFSARGFSARYEERTGFKIPNIETFFEMASSGDEHAKAVLEDGTDKLAECIRNLVHTINPECVALSGGISLSYDRFGKRLENRIREITFPIFREYTRIIPGGTVAGALGAASLCLK